jgi:hypothetical protein
MNAGQVISVLFFFIISFGLGYSLLWLVRAKRPEHPALAILEMLGVGVGLFSFLGVVLNLLHIPLHYLVYAALAIICPLLSLFLPRRQDDIQWKNWRNQQSILVAILLLVMIATFLLFWKGATAYPYLEDDDPWNHAQGATYVARMHTYTVDPEVRQLNTGYGYYLEPYPPTYDIIMGIMRQLNDSITWTLKFYNVLLITITLAFIYLFLQLYLKSSMKAIFATLILAALPSFMSHFIWSQTLAIALLPVALYAMLRALDEKSWMIPAMILIASELVTQPVVSFVFGVVVLTFVLFLGIHEYARSTKGSILQRLPQTSRAFITGAGGFLLSFIFWGAQLIRWGVSGFQSMGGEQKGGGWISTYTLQKYSLWNMR